MPDSTSSSCGPNKEFSQGLCQNRCRDGFTGKGSSCQKQCPTTGQFLNLGPLCQKVPIKRPSGTVPFIQNCPTGYVDNGRDCISPLKCAWPNQCSGTNLPAITFPQRLTCYGANSELVNGLCQDKCPKGYIGSASSCLPNCPDDFQDTDPLRMGSHCIKPTQGRGLGEPPAQSPIQTIAKSPNGSTFLERQRAGLTPQNVGSVTNAGVFGTQLGDPGQPGVDNQAAQASSFFGSTVSAGAQSLGGIYNKCKPPSPQGPGPVSKIIWNILWIFILVGIILTLGVLILTYGETYGVQLVTNLFSILGAAVTGAGGVVVKATKAAGEEVVTVVKEAGGVAVQGVQEGGNIVGQAAQSTGTIVSGVGRGLGTAISGVAQGAGTGISGAAQGAGTAISGIAQGFGTEVSGVARGIGTGVSGVARGIGTGVSGVARGVGTGVSGIAQGFGTGLRGIERGTGEALAGIPEAVNIIAPAAAAAGQNVAASIMPNNVPVGYTPINFASTPFLPVGSALPTSTQIAPGVTFNF